MSLVHIREYIRKTFSIESAPHEHTVRRWIATGKIPGRQIGCTWYVDSIAFEANGNPLVAKVLRDVSRSA